VVAISSLLIVTFSPSTVSPVILLATVPSVSVIISANPALFFGDGKTEAPLFAPIFCCTLLLEFGLFLYLVSKFQCY